MASFVRVVARPCAGLFLFAALLATTGCGPSVGDLTGKVMINGKPLTKGQVMVQAANGMMVAGEVASDGSYKVVGVPVGTAKVAVSAPSDEAVEYFKKMSAGSRGGQTGDKGAPQGVPKENPNANAVPAKYTDVSTSDLSTTINGGTNTFDITIK